MRLQFDGIDVSEVTKIRRPAREMFGGYEFTFEFSIPNGESAPNIGDVYQVMTEFDDGCGRYEVRSVEDGWVKCARIGPIPDATG